MTIEATDLTVTYRGEAAITAVSFTARSGTITGIVGPNGAGKSTTLKAVMGLVRRDCGTVSIDSHPLEQVRKTIAYLPQRVALDWDYPAQVQEVVAMGRYPHLRMGRRRQPADRDAVRAALDRVGLSDLSTRQIGELSGGQQQRMLLGRALAQEASTLLLDEPFAAVDTASVRLLSGLLRGLARDGACIVVVNHDLATTSALCDHVVMLNRSVVTQGPPEKVLTPEWCNLTYVTPRPAEVADQGRLGAPAFGTGWQA